MWEHFILGEEMWAAGEPRGAQYMNVNWIGPTLMRFGTAEQKERYIPEIAAGSAIWCQGFSEPYAGSDLGSLRTRAERDGDDYVINGSKIWTSYAGLADHCFLLARTSGNRKNGIASSCAMRTPGINVRAIPSLIGDGDIHEVFFDDVRIPVIDAGRGRQGLDADRLLARQRARRHSALRARRTHARVMVAQLKADRSWKDDISASRRARRWPPARRPACWSIGWSTSARAACRRTPSPASHASRSSPPKRPSRTSRSMSCPMRSPATSSPCSSAPRARDRRRYRLRRDRDPARDHRAPTISTCRGA